MYASCLLCKNYTNYISKKEKNKWGKQGLIAAVCGGSTRLNAFTRRCYHLDTDVQMKSRNKTISHQDQTVFFIK